MEQISVTVKVKGSLEKIWGLWTGPEHIKAWNIPMDGWPTTEVVNNVKQGGRFNFKMESQEEGKAFDYCGTYDKVVPYGLLDQILDDGRTTKVLFRALEGETEITESFEPVDSEPIAMQREFCKLVLLRFKAYAEQAPL